MPRNQIPKNLTFLGKTQKATNVIQHLNKLNKKNTVDNKEIVKHLIKDSNQKKRTIAYDEGYEVIVYDDKGNNEKFNIQADKTAVINKTFGLARITDMKNVKNKMFEAINPINGEIKFNKFKMADTLPTNIKMDLFINIDMFIVINTDGNGDGGYLILRKTQARAFTKPTKANIDAIVVNKFANYLKDFGEGYAVAYDKEKHYKNAENLTGVPWENITSNLEYTIHSVNKERQYNWVDGKLRDSEPIDISNIFVNVDINKSDDCVKNLFKKNFGKKINDAFDLKFADRKDGISSQEIYDFCLEHNLEVYIYNIKGELKLSNEKNIKNKKLKPLSLIAYMNHCYEIVGKKPEKKIVKEESSAQEYKIIESANTEISKLLRKNIVPDVLKYNGYNIVSYINDGIKYIQNPDYEKCKEILKKFDLLDELKDNISLTGMLPILEKKYAGKENIESFFPESNKFIKGGFNYKSDLEFNADELVCIDKNKTYASVLKNLPYLISLDVRSCNIRNIKDQDESIFIVDHYLYLCTPKKYTELMENTNLYTGYHINKCKEYGVEYEIFYELETKKHENYFAKLITDLYDKTDSKSFKEIMVRGIGCFEKVEKISMAHVVNGIYNNDEMDRINGVFDIKKFDNDKYNLCYDTVNKITGIMNRKPINIQIKDQWRIDLHDKMKELKITTDNLCQINTDSIMYKGKLPKNLNPKKLDGWKEVKINKYDDDGDEIIYGKQKEKTIYDTGANNRLLTKGKFRGNTLCLSYAGSGKSTYIKNEILPNLASSTYIILSPSHKSIQEFKQAGFNCNVIQKYIFSNTLPTEQTIIFDEFGMFGTDEHNMMYKCSILSKTIYAIGDNNQLPPVKGRKCDNKIYLDMMFPNKIHLTDNYRNDFTKKYYDSLIEGKFNREQLIEEVKKYSTKKFYDAKQIICYRKDVVELYNNKMLKKLELEKDSIGARTMCITNKLNGGIYNSFTYKIIDNKNNFITLKDEQSGETKVITKKAFNNSKNFMPAYACTLHKLQGSSLESYYFAPEDYSFVNNTVAYVTVSRLKTK